MKRIAVLSVLLLVTISLFVSIPLSADSSDVRITEVMPYGGSEGFSLHNYGKDDVNLSGFQVTDGEGTVTFTSSLILSAGSSVTILSGPPDKWITDRTVLMMGENGIETKNFQLNDKGDEIVLTYSERILDIVVYGTGEHEDWNGPGIVIPNNRIAVRTSAFDTGTARDWASVVPGRSSFSSASFESVVTPFVFPDPGYPIFDALMSASEDVLISMYILDHPVIVYILRELLERDVNVTILLEGSPSGGVPSDEIGYMEMLTRSGAEVLIMKNTEGFRRYSYIHNKYAIIDSETVILTTENWRYSSFNTNRGWGVVSNSRDHAEYMKDVFREDADTGYGDVHPFREIYGSVIAKNVPPYSLDHIEYASYPSVVRPVLCPDFALSEINTVVTNATERIYSQQMTVDIDWLHNGPVKHMMDAASEGRDVRLMVDVTFDDPYDGDSNDGYWIKESIDGVNGMLMLTSDDSTFDGLIHNKGVVVDDMVWIGSMNWNDSSFNNNREVGVIVHSKDVSDVFGSAFLNDWGSYEGVVKLLVDTDVNDHFVVLDASSSSVPSGSVFGWDLDSDGVVDRDGMRIVTSLQEGWTTCVLHVTDPEGNTVTKTFDVHVPSIHDDNERSWLKYIPILAACIIVICIRSFRFLRKDDVT